MSDSKVHIDSIDFIAFLLLLMCFMCCSVDQRLGSISDDLHTIATQEAQ